MVGSGHSAIKALLMCGQNGGNVTHPTCVSFHHQKPRAEGTHPNDPDNSRGVGREALRDVTKAILSSDVVSVLEN